MPHSSSTASSSAASGTQPEALLAQAAAGNCAAFAAVYDRFAPHVLGIIERILADADASEQVLEEVFLRLWKEASKVVRAQVSVGAWLLLTARTLAVDRLRQRSSTLSPGAESRQAGGFHNESLTWIPDAQAIGRLEERRALLRKVLGQLPRPQLKSLELVVFAGRAERELAAELGEPLARVKTELRAATRFLTHRRRAVVGSWTVDI
ncbi:MAG TPA: sigma-70 family RNA polymerase sigma factor [Terriglobia bacterium]|nr:sigma-70 family RNA polymerase sigma factor [Terriglobia bacterium]